MKFLNTDEEELDNLMIKKSIQAGCSALLLRCAAFQSSGRQYDWFPWLRTVPRKTRRLYWQADERMLRSRNTLRADMPPPYAGRVGRDCGKRCKRYSVLYALCKCSVYAPKHGWQTADCSQRLNEFRNDRAVCWNTVGYDVYGGILGTGGKNSSIYAYKHA